MTFRATSDWVCLGWTPSFLALWVSFRQEVIEPRGLRASAPQPQCQVLGTCPWQKDWKTSFLPLTMLGCFLSNTSSLPMERLTVPQFCVPVRSSAEVCQGHEGLIRIHFRTTLPVYNINSSAAHGEESCKYHRVSTVYIRTPLSIFSLKTLPLSPVNNTQA